jgi:uncharacterized protein DUF4386
VIDESQRKAARVVGLAYPLTFVIITIAFTRFYAPLLVWNDRAQTARNIGTHQLAFHNYIALAVLYGIGLVILLAALYIILRPIGRGLAVFAAALRMSYACLWFITLLHDLGASRIVSGIEYLKAFEPERLQAMAALHLASAWDAYYIALTFYGLGTLFFSYLWWKSRYIPRTLAGFGFVSSLFAGFCALGYLLYPRFGDVVAPSLYEIPIALFELLTSFWLLARGLRPPDAQKRFQAMS